VSDNPVDAVTLTVAITASSLAHSHQTSWGITSPMPNSSTTSLSPPTEGSDPLTRLPAGSCSCGVATISRSRGRHHHKEGQDDNEAFVLEVADRIC
jgi:hypothetical protein